MKTPPTLGKAVWPPWNVNDGQSTVPEIGRPSIIAANVPDLNSAGGRRYKTRCMLTMSSPLTNRPCTMTDAPSRTPEKPSNFRGRVTGWSPSMRSNRYSVLAQERRERQSRRKVLQGRSMPPHDLTIVRVGGNTGRVVTASEQGPLPSGEGGVKRRVKGASIHLLP